MKSLRRNLGDDTNNRVYIVTEPARRLPHGQGQGETKQ